MAKTELLEAVPVLSKSVLRRLALQKGSGVRKVDYEALRAACRAILVAIGENPEREGLRDTPDRFARSWRDFVEFDAGKVDTSFQSIVTDQLVVVSKVPIFSFCEHHLAQFTCEVSIGYITGDRVLGLSKMARIAHKHAHKLQIQERLVDDIANEIVSLVGHENVAIYAEGSHSCMTSRGIRSPGTMSSSIMRGIFRDEASARMEFLQIAGIGKK